MLASQESLDLQKSDYESTFFFACCLKMKKTGILNI